jgi:hypothetical protein
MKNAHYKNFNIGKSFSDYDGALRYLKGRDQAVIKEDDPEFFSLPAERIDNVSVMSSCPRILRRAPRKHRKEAH